MGGPIQGMSDGTPKTHLKQNRFVEREENDIVCSVKQKNSRLKQGKRRRPNRAPVIGQSVDGALHPFGSR